MAALMSSMNVGQAQGAAVARLVKDQMEEEGRQAIQLIQSAGQSTAAAGGGVGNAVDVMA